ncbi:protein of unknown function DUF4373 [Vibrio phage 1.259.O._10N.286.48.F4]|nr:protein of unknown function DUF4373 [Vibrio phage 1.259.O._10N.286.48.F4]
MKWFKHDSSAHTDAKIQKILMKYRAEGYALYWYSLELIAGKVDKNNITFELEHDAEIIGFQLGIDQLRVQEIMNYMIDLGLFDVSQNNQIRCLKMAYRLDETTTKNPEVKAMLRELKSLENNPEAFRSDSGDIPELIGKPSDQTRLDQIRLDKKDQKTREKRFSKPSRVELFDYFSERGISENIANAESEKFFDFYESKNWMVGKTKMKDWKAAVRGWISRNNKPMAQGRRVTDGVQPKLSPSERYRQNLISQGRKPNF